MRLDMRELMDTLENTTKYTEGFLTGTRGELVSFNRTLGQAMVDLIYPYVDSASKMNPEKLHHVYEPGMVGDPNSRLFEVQLSRVGPKTITITGNFLRSKVVTDRAKEPFYERARVMEGGISVSISPKYEKVLVFWPRQSIYVDEDDLVTGGGEGPVVTTKTIFVEHPGGPAVEGAFGETINTFFKSYLTRAVMDPALQRLTTPDEYHRYFAEGAKMGHEAGIRAGKRFMARGANEPI